MAVKLFFVTVTYLLDFHENIVFSKTFSVDQEQPYSLEKTTIVFLDPPKNACNIRRKFMEQSGNIPIFNIPGIFPGISLRNLSEYTGNISRECTTNILRTYICPVAFLGNHSVMFYYLVNSLQINIWM